MISILTQDSYFDHPRSNYHLRNALSTQGFATNEILALQTSKCIKPGGEQESNSRYYQCACAADETEPLHDTHDGVGCRTHPRRGEASDNFVELG